MLTNVNDNDNTMWFFLLVRPKNDVSDRPLGNSDTLNFSMGFTM